MRARPTRLLARLRLTRLEHVRYNVVLLAGSQNLLAARCRATRVKSLSLLFVRTALLVLQILQSTKVRFLLWLGLGSFHLRGSGLFGSAQVVRILVKILFVRSFFALVGGQAYWLGVVLEKTGKGDLKDVIAT